MKISVQKLRQYGEQGLDLPIDKLVNRIGAQLGGVEGVEDLGAKYQGIVVAKIIKCDDHPNADRLHVCAIDDGVSTPDVKRDENGYVQVVCGAPNVRAGMLVAWLPPGSTVPSSVGADPFVLEARELRGVVSNGMLASAQELAISDDHEGILELDNETAKPGDDFAEVYKLNDYLIDIENKMFTHRPDCFGQLGVAREVSGIQQLAFRSPDWYIVNPSFPDLEADELKFDISNELPSEVPRFAAIAMSDITIGASPMWLQTELGRLGMRSISNVVDLTNYYMVLTGQPIHAYDYDKVKAVSSSDVPQIVVRNPRDNEKIRLLNGKTIDPRQEAIMIATDKQLIGIAGVMGGAETEVDEHTKNIILEVATFDMYSIRRTSMAHGLFTDAVTRFNKGQSPLQNLAVMAKIVVDIQRLAHGKVASAVVDVSQVEGREWVHPPVPVTAEFINARLGFKLSANEMQTLLENVEFVVAVDGDNLTVTAPFWRTDIETREDVVEEVGRLYGFDRLPQELPRRSIIPATKNPMLELKARMRAALSRAGANEVLTYSFVHSDLFAKVGQDKTQAFSLSNALSPDLQQYRLSLLPSLLSAVHANGKVGYDELALFELGKTHDTSAIDEAGLPLEFDNLAAVYAAQKSSVAEAAFYQLRALLTRMAQELNQELEFSPLKEHASQLDAPFALERSAAIRVAGTEQVIGVIGEFSPAVRKALKLPVRSAGFELAVGAFLTAGNHGAYTIAPKFPKITQDVTLKVPTATAYQDLYDLVTAELQQAKPAETLLHVKPLGVYQRLGDDDTKQITFRVSLANYERTLTDVEVSKLLDSMSAVASQQLQAERI